MNDSNKKPKVIFAPGCFDNFDGTQEELDSMMAEILRMAESGELLERGRRLEEEDWDELPADVQESIAQAMQDADSKRKLN